MICSAALVSKAARRPVISFFFVVFALFFGDQLEVF